MQGTCRDWMRFNFRSCLHFAKFILVSTSNNRRGNVTFLRLAHIPTIWQTRWSYVSQGHSEGPLWCNEILRLLLLPHPFPNTLGVYKTKRQTSLSGIQAVDVTLEAPSNDLIRSWRPSQGKPVEGCRCQAAWPRTSATPQLDYRPIIAVQALPDKQSKTIRDPCRVQCSGILPAMVMRRPRCGWRSWPLGGTYIR